MVQIVSTTDSPLPRFWKPLRYHEEQQKFLHSNSRFNVVPAGRRSGKTDIAIRRVAKKALIETIPSAWYILAAPTEGQARRIFWEPLINLFPKELVQKVSLGSMTVRLVNSVEISVVGLDKPERVEGRPIRHITLDEYGNIKASAWTSNIRPALSDQLGTADFIGVPEGRNHYYELWMKALADTSGAWSGFTWTSGEILPASEIEQARTDMDQMTFDQEYNAKFVNFAGRVYYSFAPAFNGKSNLIEHYNPDADLILCFDFNHTPGVAVICQEVNGCTLVLGEVYIEQGSNTEVVATEVWEKWKGHRGRVLVYGDSAGGQRTSSNIRGTDWDLVRGVLKPHFGSRLIFRVPKANPRVRLRVNSLNSRLRAIDGTVRLYIDPIACPMLTRDLEGVRYKGNQIYKPTNPNDPESKLTHISDAFGYYITRAFPMTGGAKLVNMAA